MTADDWAATRCTPSCTYFPIICPCLPDLRPSGSLLTEIVGEEQGVVSTSSNLIEFFMSISFTFADFLSSLHECLNPSDTTVSLLDPPQHAGLYLSSSEEHKQPQPCRRGWQYFAQVLPTKLKLTFWSLSTFGSALPSFVCYFFSSLTSSLKFNELPVFTVDRS
jgi:hypothetical protein